MFSKKLEDIFTPENLKQNSKSEFNYKKISKEIIEGIYIPKPLKHIEIPKPNGEKRPIAIADEIDKAIQKTLYVELNSFFDPLFSNHSYGYRPEKGTLKAIKRVKDYYKRKYYHIYKSDIDEFFETIDHEKLVNLLDLYIEDKRIIRLISQYLKNGLINDGFKLHEEGVHQGDVLSPLLSNVYLNQLDMFLERENIEFVRFADDFVLFFKIFDDAKKGAKKCDEFVEKIGLKLEKEKNYFSNFEKGFSYLGCYFKNSTVYIDKERFKRIEKSLKSLKNHPLKEMLEKIKMKYEGIKRYYFKVVDSPKQIKSLKDTVIVTITQKFKEEFQNRTKKEILELINSVEIDGIDLKRIVKVAYEMYKSDKSLIPERKISSQQKRAVKNLIKSSMIVISEYGVFLGVAKNKITLKKRGKITKTFPKSRIKRIIINSKGVSFSSNFVHMCVKEKISLEFVDYAYNPYAMIYAHNMGYPKTAVKQLEVLNSEKRLEFAKEFIRAKLTNQKNYLRYLNKYHKNLSDEVAKIKKIILKIKKASSVEELMGLEGSCGSIYWQGIGKVLREDNFRRITKGAKDTINSAFNYGYALLYNKVQEALVRAGLAVNISFLHSLDNKPTLVFDMVEEFRTYVVDRAVVFALNKSGDIDVDVEGRLTKNARKRIVEEVNERFGSMHKYNKEKRSIEDIINLQAYLLAKAINADKEYKAFVARF